MFEYVGKYNEDPFEMLERWYIGLTPDQQLIVWYAVGLLGVLVGVGFFLYRLVCERRDRIAKEKQSATRDKLAAEVGASLASNQAPPPFSLYLRPFASTGYQVATHIGAGLAVATAATMMHTAAPLLSGTRGLAINRYGAGSKAVNWASIGLMTVLGMAVVVDFILWRSYRFLKLRQARARGRELAMNPQVERSEVLSDFEDLLEDGIRTSKRPSLIGLGNPGESIGGAGRLRVPDAEWQTYIDGLLTHSTVNVLVLSPRPGTLWEIERVLSTEAWKKTIFIQPPLGGLAKGAYAPDAEYQAVRSVFERYGAKIPAMQRIGVAFGFEDLTKAYWVRQNLKSADLIAAACSLIGTSGLSTDSILGPAPALEMPLRDMPTVDDRVIALTPR